VVADTHVGTEVVRYIVALVGATRNHEQILRGASPRATLSVTAMAKAVAQLRGRDYVIPEDVVQEAIPVLAHRISAASGSRRDAESYLRRKLQNVTVPLEKIAAV
jgi:MoxR-like ATPase